MSLPLELEDIQGNIVKAYGRYGFPMARYVFFRVDNGDKGRQFVGLITPTVTTSVPWRDNDPAKIPPVAINIAFTFSGLRALDIPDDTLHAFPDEFAMGMKARRDIVGDTGPNHYRFWDPVWNLAEQATHILIGINGKIPNELDRAYQRILNTAADTGGVTLLTGHRGPEGALLDYQPAVAMASGKEHFGYSDGISNTYFNGCGENPRYVIGGGKPTGGNPRTMAGWEPLAAGEFILGQPDESEAYPEAPLPPLFSRNATYLVYRKLHQNAGTFNRLLETEGARFDGEEEFAAKIAGRWRNGAPLVNFPTKASADAFDRELQALTARKHNNTATESEKRRLEHLQLELVAFDYDEDIEGARCPFGAHTRRTNPRSALQFGVKNPFATPAALTNRRRLLRRGLPYGRVEDATRDDGDHGVVLLFLNADLSRQFEFVQQQWLNYGNDFRLANDQDPLLGNHGANIEGRGSGRMAIQGDKTTGKPPYFCAGMPTLVETRGGDYYFVPSLTCLRMIAAGTVDPT